MMIIGDRGLPLIVWGAFFVLMLKLSRHHSITLLCLHHSITLLSKSKHVGVTPTFLGVSQDIFHQTLYRDRPSFSINNWTKKRKFRERERGGQMGGEAVPLLAEEKACEGEERISGWAVSRVVGEVKRVGYLAGPMVAVTLSQYFIQVISSMMVGHLGELPLASAAIATSLAGVTGFSLLVSFFFSLVLGKF